MLSTLGFAFNCDDNNQKFNFDNNFKDKVKEKLKDNIKEKYDEIIFEKNKNKNTNYKYFQIKLTNEQNIEELNEHGINFIEEINDREYIISVPEKSIYNHKRNYLIVKEEKRKNSKIIFKDIKEIDYELKISEKILEQDNLPNWVKDNNENIYVYVKLFDKSNFNIEDIRKLQIEIISSIKNTNLYLIKISYENLKELANINYVKQIELPSSPKTDLMNMAKDYIEINKNNEDLFGLEGENINIMMYESSTPYDHADFKDRLTIANKFPIKRNHATNIAGILVGNGSLNELNKGMAPKAKLISYQYEPWIFIDFVSDMTNNYISGIENYSADLITNSWGSDFGDNCEYLDLLAGQYTAESYILDSFIASNMASNKVPIIFGAGNSKDFCEREYTTITPEASAKNVISVGSVNTMTNDLSFFSSNGPTYDGRIKPEILAPGCHNDNLKEFKGISTTNRNQLFRTDNYKENCGTSISAPFVSGTIALMTEELKKDEISLLPSTFKAILIDTANEINEKGPDYQTGFGVLNSENAIKYIKELAYHEDTYDGETIEYEFTLSSKTEIKVTLAWDDIVQESLTANKELVNDLDLKLLSPSGKEFFPWTLDSNNPENLPSRNLKDDRNNIEQVYIYETESEIGEWTIQISCEKCSEQAFSLASRVLIENNFDNLDNETDN